MITYKLSDFIDSSILPPENIIFKIDKLYGMLKIDECDNNVIDYKNKKNKKKSDINIKPVIFTKNKNTTQSEEELLNNNLRVFLNKISVSNYDVQKENIIQILDIFNEKCILNDALLLYLELITINRSIIDVYVKLWIDILERYDSNTEHILNIINKYTKSIDNVNYIDPDIDYDNHCKVNKENDKRRNLIIFVGKLIQKEKIDINELLMLVNSIILKVRENSKDIASINITNEYIELLYLCLDENIHIIKKTPEWNNINSFLQEYVKIDRVINKGISSRLVFKLMDINEKILKKI